MNRRNFIQTGVAAGAFAMTSACRSDHSAQQPDRGIAGSQSAFELEETTIERLRQVMERGEYTARSITELYLKRIEELDRRGPSLYSILETNPDALRIAEQLDKERAEKGPRGPLHGIPVLVKDNIGTNDRMTTTAGSAAMAGSICPRDSFVAQKLRDGGAILLGKANMSEWAGMRSAGDSTAGFSGRAWDGGRGGFCKNPYFLDRSPCGSSSGSAVATSANLCPISIGTETDGSIILPASMNGIVGIKPTVGLISRSMIIPISHTQDTAGPMARTVRDAAILLGVLSGMDPNDSATQANQGHAYGDYTQFLDPDGLRGARIGVARQFAGADPRVDELLNAAIDEMKKAGAIVVDPADLPALLSEPESEFEVLLYEFKADLNAYLAELGSEAPMKTLREIIDFNEKNKAAAPFANQKIMIDSEAKGPLTEKRYLESLDTSRRLSRMEGIDLVLNKYQVSAVVAPSVGPAPLADPVTRDYFKGTSTSPAAMAGYPSISVPMGQVYGLPVGISFFGTAFSEPILIRLAFAFEQKTQHRRPPRFLPTVKLI